MNVSTIHSATSAYQPQFQSVFKQCAQDFKALQTALDSGDMSAAQQAFAALQQDKPNQASQASSASSNTVSDPSSQIGKDFQSLQSALQSGDIKSAQSAFATLQQDMKGAGGVGHAHGHHRHHHAPEQSTQGNTNPVTSTSPADSADGTASVGTLLDTQG